MNENLLLSIVKDYIRAFESHDERLMMLYFSQLKEYIIISDKEDNLVSKREPKGDGNG